MIKIVLVLAMVMMSFDAWAGRSIQYSYLNGGLVATVESGDAVEAKVYGIITGYWSTTWGSTSYTIDGDTTCINHNNLSGSGASGILTYSFLAPDTAGTYSVVFYAFSNDTCTWSSNWWDNQGSSPSTATLIVEAGNTPPTDISISNSSVYAGSAVTGATVGQFSTTDADSNMPFSYQLVNANTTADAGSCSASTDNGSFSIASSYLQFASNLAVGTYDICVMTTDAASGSYKEQFTISVTNQTPTGITLTNSSITSSGAVNGAPVGTFDTIDPDNSLPYAYSLVSEGAITDGGSCTASTGNSSFQVSGGALFVLGTLNAGEYLICVQTIDNYNKSFKQNLTITVTNNPPSAIALSQSTVAKPNVAINATVGTLTNTDADGDAPYSYALADVTASTTSGSCSADSGNSQFQVDGDQLQFAQNSAVGTYQLCMSVADAYGNSFKQTLTVNVTNNPPTDISLDNQILDKTATSAGSVVGNLTTTDGDANDSFVYSLSTSSAATTNGSCTSATGNDNFQISGGQLQTSASLTSGNYEICIQTKDLGGSTYQETFTVTINETVTATFLDTFDVVAYDNNDGEQDWASAWLETGDDTLPGSGDIQIVNNELLVSNAVKIISRAVDLGNYGTADISFDFRIEDTVGGSESFDLDISKDGITWVTLKAFSNNDADGTYSVNIDDYLYADTQIRIATQPDMEVTDQFYINNFAINGTIKVDACHNVWPSGVNTSSSSYFNITQDMANATVDYTRSGAIDSLPAQTLVYDNFDVSLSNLNFDGTDPVIIYANHISITGSNFNLDTPNPLILVAVETLNMTGSVVKGAIYSKDPNTTVTGSALFGGITSTEAIDFVYDNADNSVNNLFFDPYFFEEASLNDECEITALSCPVTTSYTSIFSDDFSSDDNNWQVVDFDKSGANAVELWPGDSIFYSSGEEQNVKYSISGGKLNVAGAVSSSGDNEYGAILRNLQNIGYDTSNIESYTVETTVTANAGGSTNNDVGVVFGYEDPENFYLVRWTKIAVGYSGNTTFPGTYRSLDVLKVANGTTTLLDSLDFYEDDDFSIRVTVNFSGISICINGVAQIVVASERPTMGQIGLFTYDNDIGVSFDNFEVTCLDCEATLVDHYVIEHNGTGLTCLANSVTVKACKDESCSATVATDVTGSIVSSGSQGSQPLNFDSGMQVLPLSQTTATTIGLTLTNMSPESANGFTCLNTSNASTSCDMAFADAGYLVSIDDFTASSTSYAQVNGGNIGTVQAVKADDAGTSCVPSYTGVQNVNVAFNYSNPNSGTQSVGFSTDNSNYSSLTAGTVSSQTLNFSAATATASFYLAYPDVGQLNLSFTDPDGVLVVGSVATGSDAFVVHPAQLQITAQDSSSTNLSGGTYIAGQPFNLAIKAVNLDGAVTPNYQPSDLALRPTMVGPLTANGASVSDFYYGQTTPIEANNSGAWSTITATFNNGIYAVANASFDEVGEFTLDVRDNYNGTAVSSSGVISAGRFTPAYFDIVAVTAGDIGDTHAAGVTPFSYIGETLSYATQPKFQVIAKNYKDQTTNNYDEGYSQFTGANVFDLATRRYTDNGTSGLFNGGTLNTITLSDAVDWDGTFEFTLDDNFSFTKNNVPVGAFAVDLALQLLAADLIDADGIGYDADGSANGFVYGDYDVANITGAEVRYGRIQAENNYGPETTALVWTSYIEVFESGNGWVRHTDDIETTLLETFVSIDGLNDFDVENDATKYTLDNTTATTYLEGFDGLNSTTAALGVYQLSFAPPGDGNIGSVPIAIDLTSDLPWLQFDWDADGSLDATNPTTTVTFGRYRGNDRIIYRREQ